LVWQPGRWRYTLVAAPASRKEERDVLVSVDWDQREGMRTSLYDRVDEDKDVWLLFFLILWMRIRMVALVMDV